MYCNVYPVDIPDGIEDIEDIIDPEVLRRIRTEVKRSPKVSEYVRLCTTM